MKGAKRLYPRMIEYQFKTTKTIHPKAPFKISTKKYWLNTTLLIQDSKWKRRPLEVCCCVVPQKEYPNMEHVDQYPLQPLLNLWWLKFLSVNNNQTILSNYTKALSLLTHLLKSALLYINWKSIRPLPVQNQPGNYLLVGGMDSCVDLEVNLNQLRATN